MVDTKLGYSPISRKVGWQRGDIGATTGPDFVSRLIQTGQRIHGDAYWKWNHIFIVIDDAGNTVEALANGVCKSNVANHKEQFNLGCPLETDRERVANYATSKLNRD